MPISNRIRNTFLILIIIVTQCGAAIAKSDMSILERSVGNSRSLFHVGLWVEDIDEMLDFLSEIMDFTIELRAPRQSGGERLLLSDKHNQTIELLSDPAKVVAHPDFALHPQGRVAGIAHISIWVDNVKSLKKRLVEKGYEILAQVPDDYSDGYVEAENSKYRILFVNGPSSVSFELFEVLN